MTQTVFLGVDFGTSFTKIAFQVLPSAVKDIISIPYETADNPFFPSVVYFNPATESLSWNKEPDTIEVKYFKYAMAFDELSSPAALQMQCGDSKQAAELCSIFYLACLFHAVRSTIEACVLQHGEPATSLRWAVNMGIPTKSIKNERIVRIYTNVLQCAWALSFDSSVDSYRMNIADLRRKRSELLNSQIGAHLNVVPELFAEVLLYHQNPNIPAGLYTVVDIGGGTMDVSTFKKDRIDKKWKVYCMSESVAPLGVEIVNNQHRFKPMIEKTYGSCVWTARSRLLTAIQNGLPHKWFLLGGGRTVQIFKKSISRMALEHSRYIKNQFEGNIANLIPSQWVHNPIGNRPDRLITSQMLAQPFGAIPSVEGDPNTIVPPFRRDNLDGDFQYGITDT